MDGDLLTIGELSARSGVSKSALRFYDQCALLRPAAVDDATGYRYYDPAQVADAELIRRLRAAELGVEAIRRYLAAGAAEREALLDAHLERLDARHTELRGALKALRAAGGRGAPVAAELAGAELAAALAQVLPFAAHDGARPELGGILVECREGSLRLVASDSFRLAIRDLVPRTAGAGMRALVPAPALGALAGDIAGCRHCRLSAAPGGGLALDLDGESSVLAGIGEDFPDYEQVLAGLPAAGHGVVGREALAAALTTCEGPARLRVSPRGRLAVGGTQLACDWQGPPIDVLLDAGFLAEALAAHRGPDVVLEASEPLAPVTVRSADSGTFTVWIMPIRPQTGEVGRAGAGEAVAAGQP